MPQLPPHRDGGDGLLPGQVPPVRAGAARKEAPGGRARQAYHGATAGGGGGATTVHKRHQLEVLLKFLNCTASVYSSTLPFYSLQQAGPENADEERFKRRRRRRYERKRRLPPSFRASPGPPSLLHGHGWDAHGHGAAPAAADGGHDGGAAPPPAAAATLGRERRRRRRRHPQGSALCGLELLGKEEFFLAAPLYRSAKATRGLSFFPPRAPTAEEAYE